MIDGPTTQGESMKRNARAILLVLLSISVAGSSIAAEKKTSHASATTATKHPAAPERVTSVEGITEYRLPNGLLVLLFPDQTKPTVTVNLTYEVGSRHESYGETGMAHLLEHMMFKGTPTHGNIPQELKGHGANYNASTWYDRTNYFEILPATDENLRFALGLEADRMVHSFIARKDLDSEMTVVRNEFEAGENDPSNILEERTLSTAYLWHNYGHSTIGSREDIERVPIERLQNFWRKYYQPDNAVLLIAGKFDEPKTLSMVTDAFGKIPRPTRKLEEPYTVEPVQDGERSVTLRRVGDVQDLIMVYHVPAAVHPDFAPVQILARVLADTPSGRLYKSLVEAKKATAVSSELLELHDPGFVAFEAQVRQEQSLDEARQIMSSTIDALKSNPPTKEEVDRARTALLKNIDMTLNAADRVGLAMSESIAAGDWRLFFINRDRLRAVTPADVQRVAATYLKVSNRTVGEFLPDPKPDRSVVPATPAIASVVEGYKGDAALAAGEAFDPSPSNIETRTTRSTLASGVKLALLPKKTRGNTVVASMTLRFGDEKSLMNRSTAATAAAALLTRGTSKHTRQQMKDEFDRLKARVSVTGGPAQAIISAETTRENLPAVLALIAEALKEPVFPATELDQWKQQTLAGAEEQRTDPQSIAVTAFSRHMNDYPQGDVRYISTPEEDIKDVNALTLDQVKSFYQTFYGASAGELAIVGDFDPKQTAAQAADLFGSWKSTTPFTRVPHNFQNIAPVNQSLETPDKANALFLAGTNLNIRDDDADYPALVIGNYILGGGTLYSRLGNRIRQKEGLSYGVGSQVNASPFDKSGAFTTFAIYAPQNVTKLETAFREEVARALKDGFTADEVTEAKKGYLESRKLQRAQDNALARTLAAELYSNRTLKWDADFEQKIAELTLDQVNTALRRWIDPSKITIIKAGDFAKASSSPAAPKQ
jgi:zinc protease